MRGKYLYRALAEASLANARRLRHDAKALQRRGSRGHACSLSVLAIEESAKSIIYKQASDGVIRFVKKNANGFTTYSEQDLRDHKYKQGTIARIVGEVISYSPLHQALAETRKKTFSRAEVERLLRKAHMRAQLMASELQSEGRTSKEFQRFFRMFSRLDFLKNAGLYVGREGGRVQRPDDEVSASYSDVTEAADLSVAVATEVLRRKLSRQDRIDLREQSRMLLAQARRLSQTPKTTVPNGAHPIPAPSKSSRRGSQGS